MTNASPIRVLLVDDHPLFRKGIASLLTGEPGFEVVGEAGDGLQAVALLRNSCRCHRDGREHAARIPGWTRRARSRRLSVCQDRDADGLRGRPGSFSTPCAAAPMGIS